MNFHDLVAQKSSRLVLLKKSYFFVCLVGRELAFSRFPLIAFLVTFSKENNFHFSTSRHEFSEKEKLSSFPFAALFFFLKSNKLYYPIRLFVSLGSSHPSQFLVLSMLIDLVIVQWSFSLLTCRFLALKVLLDLWVESALPFFLFPWLSLTETFEVGDGIRALELSWCW